MHGGRDGRLQGACLPRTIPPAVFAFAILAFGSKAAGQGSYPEDLSKWSEVSIFQDASYWDSANGSPDEWVVYLRDGRPSVRVLKRNFDPRSAVWGEDRDKLPFAVKGRSAEEDLAGYMHVAKATDGWIVGFNRGEFGASLWWFSPDGKRRSRISKDQVRGFIQTDHELFALEGLAHMAEDRGQVLRIVRGSNDKWSSERVVNLGSAPGAGTRDKDGSLIIVTNKRLMRVRVGKPVETLLDNVFWSYLYPNSVIIDGSGAVYIGMRKGVAKAMLKGPKTLTWLVPK